MFNLLQITKTQDIEKVHLDDLDVLDTFEQKKDIVYHWECQADGCKSAYIGETSRALGE